MSGIAPHAAPAPTPAPTPPTPTAHWSLSVLIAISRQSDIPLPASLSNQLYEKVTPLETFAWEGKRPEDISATFKNATLDLGLQLPILKSTAAWFGTAPVHRMLVGGEGRTVRQFGFTLPDGQKYAAGGHIGVYGLNQLTVILAYLKRINTEPDTVVKNRGRQRRRFYSVAQHTDGSGRHPAFC